MTKEELKKRLKFIKATPLVNKVPPRDVSRRDVNRVDNVSEYDIGEFDDFFEFEEDLSEMESARKQVERVETAKIKAENKQRQWELDNPDLVAEEEETFLTFEEEVEQISGSDSSFFTFEEEEDEVKEVTEEAVEEAAEKDSTAKEDPVIKEKNLSKEKAYTEVKGFEFKYCKYIKSNSEQCKRQAPKNGKYCGTHRKMLEKQG